MPTIAIVDGVKIQMFYDDHAPPHFHVIGKGVFAPLADPAFFAQVRVGEGGRSLEWPGELDFCADALWFKAHPEDAPQPQQRASDQTAEHPTP